MDGNEAESRNDKLQLSINAIGVDAERKPVGTAPCVEDTTGMVSYVTTLSRYHAEAAMIYPTYEWCA